MLNRISAAMLTNEALCATLKRCVPAGEAFWRVRHQEKVRTRLEGGRPFLVATIWKYECKLVGMRTAVVLHIWSQDAAHLRAFGCPLPAIYIPRRNSWLIRIVGLKAARRHCFILGDLHEIDDSQKAAIKKTSGNMQAPRAVLANERSQSDGGDSGRRFFDFPLTPDSVRAFQGIDDRGPNWLSECNE